MRLLREWRRRRILERAPLSDACWEAGLRAHPVLLALEPGARARLRRLATLFVHEKVFVPVGGAQLEEGLRVRIAALACLPVLDLGLEWYRGFATVVVYAGAFISPRRLHDEYGLVHEWDEALSGETSARGPVVLSLADVRASGLGEGYNVVVHEMAHKLDMLNGEANGFPPLHAGMRAESWSAAFNAAYEDLKRRVAKGETSAIDPYAAEDPGEFFAVLSECFFEVPARVAQDYPAVYSQLREFYRQDPLANRNRVPPVGSHAQGSVCSLGSLL